MNKFNEHLQLHWFILTSYITEYNEKGMPHQHHTMQASTFHFLSPLKPGYHMTQVVKYKTGTTIYFKEKREIIRDGKKTTFKSS